MRKVFWLLLAAFLIWAWQNPEKVRTSWSVASKWIGEKSRMVADKYDPVDANEQQNDGTSESVTVQELPEGMFVLKQDVMISTSGAVIKWPAGTSIRKLGEGAGKVLVSDGVNQTTVDQSILTRDVQERRSLYKRLQSASVGQAKMQAQELERELAAVESKILSLQTEKRQLLARQAEYGTKPMSTSENFLDLAIKTQEQRRLDIYKLLGRSQPQMLIAR